MAGLKSYLWTFVKTNPQNELGDMISEPYPKFNRFGVINQIVLDFCSEGCIGMVGLSSYPRP